jgi:hypothetical protein
MIFIGILGALRGEMLFMIKPEIRLLASIGGIGKNRLINSPPRIIVSFQLLTSPCKTL